MYKLRNISKHGDYPLKLTIITENHHSLKRDRLYG